MKDTIFFSGSPVIALRTLSITSKGDRGRIFVAQPVPIPSAPFTRIKGITGQNLKIQIKKLFMKTRANFDTKNASKIRQITLVNHKEAKKILKFCFHIENKNT